MSKELNQKSRQLNRLQFTVRGKISRWKKSCRNSKTKSRACHRSQGIDQHRFKLYLLTTLKNLSMLIAMRTHLINQSNKPQVRCWTLQRMPKRSSKTLLKIWIIDYKKRQPYPRKRCLLNSRFQVKCQFKKKKNWRANLTG